MRVLHLAPPFTGGITSAVQRLFEVLPDRLDGVGPERARHHLRVEDASAQELAAATFVHCHHALRWPEAHALARRLGVPVAKTLHINQARQSRMRGLALATPTRSEALQARAISEADALTIATHAAKAMLLEDHPGLDPARVRVLPFAPGLPVLPRLSHDPPAPEGPVIAATRFDALKGTDLLVDVVARVLRAPGRRFVIAGGLPDKPRADARWRHAFHQALSTEQRARLTFAGWLAPDALAALLASARVFVTCSRLETCGLGLLEAVAAGCPAVATDLAVHREVAGARAEYAAPAADALAAAIEHALSAAPASGTRPWRAAHVAPDWLHFWSQTR